MSKVRVYELAKEMGLEAAMVVQRCEELSITVDNGHLTQLGEGDAERVRAALKAAPSVGVTQKRVGRTVVRRRRRARDESEVQATPQPVVAAEPKPAPVAAATARTPVAEVVAPAPEPAPQPAPVVAAPAPAPEPVVEAPAPAPGPAPEPVVEAPAPTAAPAAPVVEVAAAAPVAAEPVAPTTVAPAPKPKVVQAVASSNYSDFEAVNTGENKKIVEEPVENRESFVKVVRRLDPGLTQNLIVEAQRRADRVARGPRPGGGPRGPGGPPGGPRGPGGPPGPVPGMLPAGDPRRKKARRGGGAPGGGRVAWERHKDRRFNDRSSRMRGKRRGQRKVRTGAATEVTVPKASKRVVKMEETITVGALAQQLSVKASEIIKILMGMGEMVTVNHVLDLDTVSLVAEEFNFTVENVAFDIESFIPKVDTDEKDFVRRDPVVTVMGHVDHGKTSLLDYIRKARVAAGEAGGITQHIGAYKVPVKVADGKRSVVFLDTPGHAAFTAMRARGAQVTDVVILVIAADDGVKPQTAEAINHAKAAGVPLVVAMNKIDKPEANPEKVKQQLTEFGIIDEAWGGDAQIVEVSAKTGQGVDQLLESVILQSDVLELQAIADKPAMGVVVEAELSKGRGPVATVLVQEGTLSRGDIVVAGKAMGRVRALVDDRGRQVKQVGPATPVEVLGLNEVPPPSERFFVVKDERDGRQVVSHLEDKEREKRLAEERKSRRVSLDDLLEHVAAGDVQSLNLIIKSDVQGSLEALRHAFGKLTHPEIEVRIVHAAVGAISESDVNLASASNGVIIGFNVRPEKNAKSLAEQESVDIRLYSVIYTAVDDVKAAMEGMLSPNIEERFLGKAAIRDTFGVPKVGTVAGCAVLQGKLVRNARCRLVRDGIVITESRLDSLRRFKENVMEVDRGHECGAHIENYNDVKVGDEIECFELIEVAQTLDI